MDDKLLKEIIRCGRDMRRLQKEYFRTREKVILRECKGCERHFDELLKAAGGADVYGMLPGMEAS